MTRRDAAEIADWRKAHGAPVSVPPWESTRCRSCQRLLCKNTRNALRPDCAVEIKCGHCKTLNYLMGRPE